MRSFSGDLFYLDVVSNAGRTPTFDTQGGDLGSTEGYISEMSGGSEVLQDTLAGRSPELYPYVAPALRRELSQTVSHDSMSRHSTYHEWHGSTESMQRMIGKGSRQSSRL